MGHSLFLPYFKIVQSLLIVQFAFIGMHILFAFLMTFFIPYSDKRKRKKFSYLKEKLLTCVRERTEWTRLNLRRSLCTIPLLIPTIRKIDEEIKDAHWDKIKASIFENILFPTAQKYSYSRKWTKRIQAIGCFLHFIDKKNEEYLLHLIKDTTPIIQYAAAYSAAKLGTLQCTNAILDKMNQANHFLRIPLREALSRGDSHTFGYLESRLESDKDPFIRVSCLEVLSSHMNAHISELARKDLYAPGKNLRIAAIRALGHAPDPINVTALTPLLKDPEWEIRAITARSLGYLKAKEALSELTLLLKDEIWWVRINSAIALKRLGEEGKKKLEQQTPQEDQYAYQMAQYILNVNIYE